MTIFTRLFRRWWLFVPLIAVLAGTITVAVIMLIDNATSPPANEDRTGADRVCRQQVLAKLRAPATAQFTGTSVAFLPGETAEFYTARGEVDAQNGFGAVLRMGYQCDVTRERDLSWRVTNVVVG